MAIASKEYAASLRRRMDRHRAFYARKTPGDLLVHINFSRGENLNLFLSKRFGAIPLAEALDPRRIPAVIAEYVAGHRKHRASLMELEDDVVPDTSVYWGIGGITAAMTGRDPVFSEGTSWLDCNMGWDEIPELRFDPANKWVDFALNVNRALWALWEEDFHVLPFLHRSPLDAALGIRGVELLVDLYEQPRKVKALLDWCVDWQLSVERYLETNVVRPAPDEWGTAVWGTWLPHGAVFVNGDPVGLISRECALEFEQPYTGRLFMSSGGGFFHNHAIGYYQADLVSATPGTLVQCIVNDPKVPTCVEALLDNAETQERLLAASLLAPVYLIQIPPDRLDAAIDVARHGRFILDVACGNDKTLACDVIRKIRRASRME